MRTIIATLLMLSMALAGCAGESEPDDEAVPTGGPGGGNPSPTQSGTSTQTSSQTGTSSPNQPVSSIPLLSNFGLQDCQAVHVETVRPVADVQALLPANFTASDTNGNGIVGIAIWTCGNLTTASSMIPDVAWGHAYVLIDEPGTGQFAGFDHYEYTLQVFSHEDNLAQAWRAAGYEVAAGASNVTVTSLGLGPGVVQASLAEYSAELAASGQASPLTGMFGRFTENEGDGLLVWRGNYDASLEQAAGRAAVPGSPIAPIAEPDGSISGTGFYGVGASQTEMYLTLHLNRGELYGEAEASENDQADSGPSIPDDLPTMPLLP